MIAKSSRSIEQCQTNLLAVLEHHRLPEVAVLAALADRITVSPFDPSQFKEALRLRIQMGKFAPWKYFANHGTTAIASVRERVPWCSVQLVEHSTGVWEVDCDLANPDMGLAPAAGHALECLWPGKTNPFRVRAGLAKRGIVVPEVPNA